MNYADFLSADADLIITEGDGDDSPRVTEQLSAEQAANLIAQGRLVAGYVNVGVTDTAREYWNPDWTSAGNSTDDDLNPVAATAPAFLQGAPANDYGRLVDFTDPDWQQLVVDQVTFLLTERGFNAIFLDDVNTYYQRYVALNGEPVTAAARDELASQAQAMTEFVTRIRGVMDTINPDAVLIASTDPYMPDNSPGGASGAIADQYRDAVDWYLLDNMPNQAALDRAAAVFGDHLLVVQSDGTFPAGPTGPLPLDDLHGYGPAFYAPSSAYDTFVPFERPTATTGTLIEGGNGPNTLRGGDGDDIILTGAGDDIAYGGGGNDRIDPGTGADQIFGEAGDDWIEFSSVMVSSPQPETIGILDGGADFDTLDLRAVWPVTLGTISTSPGVFSLGVYVGSQRYSILNVERILLGDRDDTATLNQAPFGTELYAGGGDDDIMAGPGHRVFGEGGNDSFFISGAFGTSVPDGLIDGGAGINTLRTNIAFTVDLAAGTATAGNATYAISNIQNVLASPYSGYSTTVYGDGFSNAIGVDPVSSSGTGSMVFYGRGGNDTLTGGLGNDILDGGEGTDTAVFFGSRDAYAITQIADGQFEVSGPDGTDMLTSIEHLQFADGTYVFGPRTGPVSLGYAGFGYAPEAGGWADNTTYPRGVADIDGDGRADLIGFGSAGLFAALSNGDGTFGETFLAYNGFGASNAAGGWANDDLYPRTIADVNGDGLQDLIGFGSAGVSIALGQAPASGQAVAFGPATLAYAGFGASDAAGGWTSADTYPRTVADVNGDGRGDLVGFGGAGVYVALGQSDGSFGATQLALNGFGASDAGGGWSSDDRFPRVLADVNNDGRADIVGFAANGTYVALGQSDGSFGSMMLGIAGFGYADVGGGWSTADRYPRTLGDVNGDGVADIIGFGGDGTYVALGRGDGTFGDTTRLVDSFGQSDAGGGWSSNDRFPRFVADIDGDGLSDLVGFGGAGAYVARANVEWVRQSGQIGQDAQSQAGSPLPQWAELFAGPVEAGAASNGAHGFADRAPTLHPPGPGPAGPDMDFVAMHVM
ncbi:FG-GAP-like repeat-containing protein [Alteriqipengyuania lutimaris]|uniref:FG-GAP-like repeat-containing protein n=1 Tax=Alteriqipengyuania lutimaris TaxID=1538146 RepID=UPI001CFCC858|nr:FG-GAP-like repeat-containing protein [Alteriqipengyuania lutimaris]